MLDGRYTVKVIWAAPYRGELTIANGAAMLHREPVSLSCNSEFGLDVGEVASWQDAAHRFRRQAAAVVDPRASCALAPWCGAQHRTGFER